MKHFFTFLFIALTSLLIAQTTTETLMHDGENRQFILHVPAAYNPATDTVPLIVALHGLGDNMNNFSQIGFHQLANTENFIVATPQALNPTEIVSVIGQTFNVSDFLQNAWNSGAGGTSMPGVPITLATPLYPSADHDDVGFVSAIMDQLSANYNINEDRIYATGFSMGGFMTNRVACELGDRIAAVASVGGTLGSGVPTCLPYKAIPSAHFHSKDDATVAYSGNTWGKDAEELVAHWVFNNQCDATPTIEQIPNSDNDAITVVKYLYENGNANSEVEFWEVTGADHVGTWMGGSQEINTTLKIWEFFERHEKSAIDSSYHDNMDTTAISNHWVDNNIVVAPNPASDIVTVSNVEDFSELSLVNMLGQTILTKDVSSASVHVDVAHIPNGVYVLQLVNAEGSIATRMLDKR